MNVHPNATSPNGHEETAVMCDTARMEAPAPSGPDAPTAGPLRIAILDDEEMVLAGLTAWLTYVGADVDVAIATSNWLDMLAHPNFPVDVVLLDFKLGDHIPAASKVATLKTAGVASVIVSTHATATEVRACIDAGALGYLSKSDPPEEINRAVRYAAAGKTYVNPDLATLLVVDREQTDDVPRLSPQELRAFTLYASGLPMKGVAARLHVSYDTAKDYVDRVRVKYEQAGRRVRNKVELYQRAVEDGYVKGDPPEPSSSK